MDFWYHGSPAHLNELRSGSTITVHRNLARIFSHKPAVVSINEDGTIKHNGDKEGLLYIIAETVDPSLDIELHPASTMGEGMEWLTKRTLKLEFIEAVGQPDRDDLLTEEDIMELLKLHR
ncbi:hypothetical protein [Paenibacillus tepidiphilus]|uniref:hypothetical protein n=1 Tax=Paenibacillus tepidiphilus TaxID=2608683 RepID=UPI00123A67A8|nr:hypothetical protein [Paenibacillus tepidiphilus]